MSYTCPHTTQIREKYRTYCADCGKLLDEDNIVSEFQFLETRTGTRLLSQSDSSAKSREKTLFNFDQRARSVAGRLYLGNFVLQRAQEIYLKLLNNRQRPYATRARPIDVTVAACFYFACKGGGLLIDDFAAAADAAPYELRRAIRYYGDILQQRRIARDYSAFVTRFSAIVRAAAVDSEIIDKPSLEFYQYAQNVLQYTQYSAQLDVPADSAACAAYSVVYGAVNEAFVPYRPEGVTDAMLAKKAYYILDYLHKLQFTQNRAPLTTIAASIYLAAKLFGMSLPLELVAGECFCSEAAVRGALFELRDMPALQARPFEEVLRDPDVRPIVFQQKTRYPRSHNYMTPLLQNQLPHLLSRQLAGGRGESSAAEANRRQYPPNGYLQQLKQQSGQGQQNAYNGNYAQQSGQTANYAQKSAEKESFEWQDVYYLVPTQADVELAAADMAFVTADAEEQARRAIVYSQLYERKISAIISRRIVSARLSAGRARRARGHRDQVDLLTELSRSQKQFLRNNIFNDDDNALDANISDADNGSAENADQVSGITEFCEFDRPAQVQNAVSAANDTEQTINSTSQLIKSKYVVTKTPQPETRPREDNDELNNEDYQLSGELHEYEQNTHIAFGR